MLVRFLSSLFAVDVFYSKTMLVVNSSLSLKFHPCTVSHGVGQNHFCCLKNGMLMFTSS